MIWQVTVSLWEATHCPRRWIAPEPSVKTYNCYFKNSLSKILFILSNVDLRAAAGYSCVCQTEKSDTMLRLIKIVNFPRFQGANCVTRMNHTCFLVCACMALTTAKVCVCTVCIVLRQLRLPPRTLKIDHSALVKSTTATSAYIVSDNTILLH